MKIIVNQTTDLQVIDESGNVLYNWNPFEDKISNYSDLNIPTDSVIEAIRKSYTKQ